MQFQERKWLIEITPFRRKPFYKGGRRIRINPNRVTEKLTEIIQILSEHYDYAVTEDNAAMAAVHEKKAAQHKYDALDQKMAPEIKEMISDLIGAYDEENHLLSVYAFLHGLKCGIRLDKWIHTEDEPLFFELIGKKDYMERTFNLVK